MEKVTVRVDVTLMTTDGEMRIVAGIDQWGCVKAELTVKEMTWPELFADMEEFKEFVGGLPIIEGIEMKEYQLERVA
jgi:hypothetical protein